MRKYGREDVGVLWMMADLAGRNERTLGLSGISVKGAHNTLRKVIGRKKYKKVNILNIAFQEQPVRYCYCNRVKVPQYSTL